MSHRPKEKRLTGEGEALPNQGSQFSRRADAILDEANERRKRAKAAATCGARLALAGGQLFESGAGTFTVACGGFLRHFGDITALQAFVATLGGDK